MSFGDSTTLGGLAESFAYGGIPGDMILQKYSQSDIDDNPDQSLIYFMQGALMDRTIDRPYREEQFHRSVDDPEFGKQSEQYLSLRHTGTRSGASPNLPDGLFMDFDHTRPDPRGTSTLPPLEKLTEQRSARASMIKFYPDASPITTGGERSAYRRVRDNASFFAGFKNRFRNFAESLGAFPVGSGGFGTPKPITCDKYETDNPVHDLSDACVRSRSDAVTKMSNDPRNAYRHSTTDHRVKSSHNAAVRAPVPKYTSDDAKYMGTVDHKMVYFDGKLIRRPLADIMYDLSGRNEQRMFAAQGARYNESHAIGTRRVKLAPGDLTKLAMMNKNSQPTAQNFSNLPARKRHQSNMGEGTDASDLEFSQPVAASLASAARKAKTDAPGDLRDELETSMADYGLYHESQMRKGQKTAPTDPTQRDLKKYTHHVEDGKTAQQYGHHKKIAQASVADYESETKMGRSKHNVKRENLLKQQNTTGPRSDFRREIREFAEQRDPAQVMSPEEWTSKGRLHAADVDMDFGEELTHQHRGR
jgi:hypothetical protein